MPSGRTEAKLFRITAKGRFYVLKSQKLSGAAESLEHERNVYAWLSGKVPVPEVQFLIAQEDMEYLCMSEVQGKILESYQSIWTDEDLITRYALALRQLHNMPLDASAPYWSLEQRLQVAQWRLQQGAIEEADIDPQFKHLSLQDLFDEMMKILPERMDEVFTHGDYCFDNLLFNGDVHSGFIDMGRGGRGDRYQDLAIAARSVQEAFGEKMLRVFFSSYGLSKPSEDKLRFYTMLDEFY